MTPKLSVLVISYNQERYLRSTLESVVEQKASFRYEIVVADDASTDESQAIIDAFARACSVPLRRSYQQKNAGDGGVTNILEGMRACRGEYLAIIDGDDYWTDPNKLQIQVDYLDAHPAVRLCFHNCRLEYDDGRPSWETSRFLGREEVTTEELLRHAMVQTSTIVMRKNLVDELGALHDQMETMNDWFIGIIASRSGPIAYLEPVMSAFRQHARSSFAALHRADQWAAFMEMYERLYDVLDARYAQAIDEAICVRSCLAAREYEKKRDLDGARHCVTRALQGRPEWLEAYAGPVGLTGAQLLEHLKRRLELYRLGALFPLWSYAEALGTDLRWWWLRIRLSLLSHIRFRRGEAVGYIAAVLRPPPHAACDLEWTAAGTEAVEVRLGRADGPLLSRTGPSGGTTTGVWLQDRTAFFLQNVMCDHPLGPEGTISITRVRLGRRV